jgi:uncharacterized membrane protein
MKFFRIPVSIIIFLLFFGVSVLEAFRTRNWMKVVFWIAIAVMFLIADSSRDKEKEQSVSH